ncbi:MAG TPA: TIGR03000 domain-containing protein [Gemmataceae bacterium]|jgi:uncharacterized protein (TIGR03000 family)
MYSIVLVMALAPGNAAPAADIDTDIRDLKRAVAELREEQTQSRIDELKLVIHALQQRITDDKLDELRRDVMVLRHEGAMQHMASRAYYMPAAESGIHRATVTIQIPSAATFVVNDKEVPVPPADPVFVTPPLEPGRDYFYDCKVTVKGDGKDVTKVKRVRVRAGEMVRINYNDMESR